MTVDPYFTTEGRPTVRIERRYPHAIEKVWRAVTMPEHLRQWFPTTVELELRVGAPIRFGALDGVGTDGIVEAVEPPRLLAFAWGDDRLTFELEPDAEGTMLALTHRFDDRYGAASFATGWEICMAALDSVLVDQPPPPPDRGIARHEQLVREFGLDRPEISETDGRWSVRVERQLTCPAEVAWDLWFGKDRETGEQRRAPAVGEPLTPYMAPEVVIGTMTEVDLHRVLAFDVDPVTGGPGDHVRVELTEGTGHGARIVLTVTGVDPAERDQAVQMWGTGAVGHLAAAAADWATAHPDVTPDA
jgi:uncharacterized protein YndB with AHSA1/START domain